MYFDKKTCHTYNKYLETVNFNVCIFHLLFLHISMKCFVVEHPAIHVYLPTISIDPSHIHYFLYVKFTICVYD